MCAEKLTRLRPAFVAAAALAAMVSHTAQAQTPVAPAAEPAAVAPTLPPAMPVPAAAEEAVPERIPEPSREAMFQVPDALLTEISRRQVELSLLELEVKKAELSQKLAEARGGALLGTLPPPLPPPTAGVAVSQSAMPLPPPPETQLPEPPAADPDVRIIYKRDGILMADLALSPTYSLSVRPGDTLPGGLRIVDIRPDVVMVRRKTGAPYALGLGSAAANF